MENTPESDLLPNVETITEGVEVVSNVYDQPGIETLEGRMGLLLQGADVQSHFIEMPPGMFTPEHAHETESIIVTLRGEWILCADGNRRVMEAGDVFWFGPGVATGYEVPPTFEDEALILVFKGHLSDGSREGFVEYITEEMNPHLEAEREDGTPFTFDEIPDDHPAKEFAASLD
ncbi:cupin domain-containing protein [Halovivax gelatinilyticus]|uniref:cupin domain-containing protein n=1 Tax=Halovivax gelatinilyticus TaxID=2961597 RepID=UPI0020CA35CB|nr:cupin domain-containing protein [Halovivax gelatinilyticus]